MRGSSFVDVMYGEAPTASSGNTALFVGIGIIAAVVVCVLVFVFARRR